MLDWGICLDDDVAERVVGDVVLDCARVIYKISDGALMIAQSPEN